MKWYYKKVIFIFCLQTSHIWDEESTEHLYTYKNPSHLPTLNGEHPVLGSSMAPSTKTLQINGYHKIPQLNYSCNL